ncbi:MAG: phage tail protein [Magnetococcales bacterium]|nr:phage tail protein [Magnetococcales bacterium]
MSEPFIGEIRLLGFGFNPRYWAKCDGQSLPISEYRTLYALIGDTFGGNQTTFKLPDLRGRVPVHPGMGSSIFRQGLMYGSEEEPLNNNNMPAHTHMMSACSDTADVVQPSDTVVLGKYDMDPNYNKSFKAPTNLKAMQSDSIVAVGESNVTHFNMQPYLTVNYCIALEGLFPSRN